MLAGTDSGHPEVRSTARRHPFAYLDIVRFLVVAAPIGQIVGVYKSISVIMSSVANHN